MATAKKQTESTDVPMSTLARMALIVSELGKRPIPKSKEHPQLRFRYHTEDDITSALRPLCTNFGLVLLPSVESEEWQSDDKAGFVRVRMRLEIRNVDNPDDVIVLHGVGHGSQSRDKNGAIGDKGAKIAMTAALRYLYLKAFLISDTIDDELPDVDRDRMNEKAQQHAAAQQTAQTSRPAAQSMEMQKPQEESASATQSAEIKYHQVGGSIDATDQTPVAARKPRQTASPKTIKKGYDESKNKDPDFLTALEAQEMKEILSALAECSCGSIGAGNALQMLQSFFGIASRADVTKGSLAYVKRWTDVRTTKMDNGDTDFDIRDEAVEEAKQIYRLLGSSVTNDPF